MKNIKIPAIVGAIVLLLLAFGSFPANYELIGRGVVLAMVVFMVYMAYEKNKPGWFWCMVFIGVLFNPFATVEFNHKAWQFIEVLAAMAFFIASKLPSTICLSQRRTIRKPFAAPPQARGPVSRRRRAVGRGRRTGRASRGQSSFATAGKRTLTQKQSLSTGASDTFKE